MCVYVCSRLQTQQSRRERYKTENKHLWHDRNLWRNIFPYRTRSLSLSLHCLFYGPRYRKIASSNRSCPENKIKLYMKDVGIFKRDKSLLKCHWRFRWRMHVFRVPNWVTNLLWMEFMGGKLIENFTYQFNLGWLHLYSRNFVWH